MFQIENISKKYGSKIILDNISFSINEGEAIGILGVNGSGKSTLLSAIADKYTKDSSIGLGYVPQENPLFDELKPIDNLKLWCKLSKAEIMERLSTPPLSSFEITSFLDKPVKKMSGGMKKRVSLASVLINQPKVLLMDEPFAALDLPAKQDILQYMQDYLANKGSIIVASHDEDIFRYCHKVFLLKDGQLIDTAALRAQGISFINILRS